jgi:hypothetical protein
MTNPTSGAGRHRAARRRLTIAQRLGAAAVVLGATGFAAALWPASASADAPIQTAWFNAVSGGGQAAPNPTTSAGGLHVAVTSDQVIAFSAVMYSLTQGSTATLEFKVSNLTATPVVNPTAPTTNPDAKIVACPTTGTWQSGDDQPIDSAPKFDCTHSIPGSLSADQTTLTFLVDSNLESTPGSLSLAILPVLTNEIPGVGTPAPVDTTQPFSLDLAKPDTNSLTVTGSAPVPPPPPVHTGATTGAAAAGKGATSGSGAASSTGSSGMSLPSSLTGTSSTSSDAGSSPVVAPQGTASSPATAPAAAMSPTKSDRAHNAALAMLLLIGIGVIAMGNGQLQRAPRLLGGAGRHAAARVPATTAAITAMPYGTRGLGRVAKGRTEPARPRT